MKQTKTFANLKDIAKVFNVPQKRISGWGILCKNDAPASPCIIIKESNTVIDVLAGKLISTGNIGWRNIAAYMASEVKHSNKELTIYAKSAPSGCKKVSVQNSTLYSIYNVRCFSDNATYL